MQLKPQKPDTELQDLVFALLGFSLRLVQFFLAVPPLLRFKMGMHILCHCMLEVYHLFSGFINSEITTAEDTLGF